MKNSIRRINMDRIEPKSPKGEINESRENFIERLEKGIQDLQTRIDELWVKANLAKADARDEYQRQIKDLDKEKDGLRRQLEDLRKSGGDAWKILKDGLDRAYKEVKASLDEAKKKFDQN
jgi:archaellum component FlaC